MNDEKIIFYEKHKKALKNIRDILIKDNDFLNEDNQEENPIDILDTRINNDDGIGKYFDEFLPEYFILVKDQLYELKEFDLEPYLYLKYTYMNDNEKKKNIGYKKIDIQNDNLKYIYKIIVDKKIEIFYILIYDKLDTTDLKNKVDNNVIQHLIKNIYDIIQTSVVT